MRLYQYTPVSFEDHYCHKHGSGLPVFMGRQYQKGYGIGSLFSSIFRSVVPIVAPIAKNVAKSIGREALSAGSDIAKDILSGKNVKASIKRRASEHLQTLPSKIVKTISNPQTGHGAVKKRQIKKTCTKGATKRKIHKLRPIDIFD